MTERVVVVTGASAGIGAALAQQLGKEGCRLVLAARRQPELEAVAAACGSSAIVVKTDVRHRIEVERLRDRALGAFGRVDVWINNAGRGITRNILDLTDEDVDEMLASNVKSALYGMQAIVPHFKERRQGHLINVSSFLGRIPLALPRSAYCAAKAALNSLTATMRMELRREFPEIHVSVVMPGMVTTDFAANALGDPPMRPPHGGAYEAQTAQEVAERIVGLIEHPVAELYTNPRQAERVGGYFADVDAFELRLLS
ncbi:MAG: SDR family oxidoreductase [Cyanobacteria bacterium REEB65]|nr:SDR family oxidoreductase [Cyanobacteria bacterium REEB65]